MKPAGWEQVRRVLAVRLDNIGDVLMTGPALRTLKEGLPGCELTLMCSPGGASAAELLPWVDQTLPVRALWQDLGAMEFDPSRELELLRRLRGKRFDAAIIFTSFSQSPHAPAYLCYIAGIPIRVGASKEFGGAVLSTELRSGPEDDPVHQVDRNLELLRAAGFTTEYRDLEVAISEGARATLVRKLEAAGVAPGDPIVVSPWASCPARTYPPERMAEAAATIAEATGLPTVLTGLERHREAAARLLERCGDRCRDLTGSLTLSEFAALVERSSLVLCNNTATMHLADALRRPLVVLYAGTDLESQWRPRRAPGRLLQRPTACSPCYRFECPFGHECLDVPAAEVAAAGLQLVEEARAAAA